jgi:hypothetical protein
MRTNVVDIELPLTVDETVARTEKVARAQLSVSEALAHRRHCRTELARELERATQARAFSRAALGFFD